MRTSLQTLALGALLAACGDSGGFPDAYMPPPLPDPGEFSVAWTLVDSGAQPATCASANASNVEVSLVDETTAAQFGAAFNCGLGDAVSGPLPVATYDATFLLLDGNSQLIATGTAQTGIAIDSDKTTVLSAVVFTVP